MSEFEDKLGAILGNPDAMAQIMSLAQNLGGPTNSAPASAPAPATPQEPPADPLFGALGELDPQLIQNGIRLFSEFSASDNERAALLEALKPFLRKERYAKVDRAIQIARLSRMVRIAFQLFKGKGEGNV